MITSLQTGASYPAVRDSDILDQFILLPPIPEQREIASTLKVVRESMLQQSKVVEAAVRLKRATTHEMFSRGLRGVVQRDSEIGLMPANWQTVPIVNICDIFSGGTPTKSEPAYWSGTIPWASGKDLKTTMLGDTIDHINNEGVDAGSRLVPSDTVLILVRGMGLAKDLPISVTSRQMAFNQDLKALVPKGNLNGHYIRAAVYHSKERLLSRIVPSAHGTMTLNLDDIETFRIPCPNEAEEAEEIVTVINAIDNKIEMHIKKRSLLEKTFRVLLRKLMNGEVRVSEFDLAALYLTSRVEAAA